MLSPKINFGRSYILTMLSLLFLECYIAYPHPRQLNLLTGYSIIFEDSVEFSTYTKMPHANKDNFTSFPLICMPLILFFDLIHRLVVQY